DSAYQPLLKNYQQTFNRFVGPTEVFVSGDTLQIKDYSKTDWPWYFDVEAKQKRHETVFPREREKAFELGTAIAKKL
ncbi:MAG: flavodoxin family protein, partial [Lachnospiraceae bacterium]|nr:flavodoxin family protein [Lachnospiraceae bacterium]